MIGFRGNLHAESKGLTDALLGFSIVAWWVSILSRL